MLVSKLLIEELVIDMNFSGLSAARVFVNGHIADQIKAHFSCKDKLRSMLREIISYSRSFEEFLKNCTDSGIEYVYTPQIRSS